MGYSQIQVSDVANYKGQVDSSLNYIKRWDSRSWKVIIDNCKKIDYKMGPFSTTEPPNTIFLSIEDFKLGSINNISAAIVHESLHLDFYNRRLKMGLYDEEIKCYKWELSFLKKVPDCEDFLKRNVKEKIKFYRKLNYLNKQEYKD